MSAGTGSQPHGRRGDDLRLGAAVLVRFARGSFGDRFLFIGRHALHFVCAAEIGDGERFIRANVGER